MLSLEEAIEKLLAAMRPVGTETVPLTELAERVLGEDLVSPNALPLFDNSAMDGWAVRSADVATATQGKPVTLRPVATIPAGQFFEEKINLGECVRIFTGSPLPAGADAVVMQEDTRVEADRTLVLDGVQPWENVRFAGEDVKKGALIAKAGDRVNAGLIGLLAACGIAEAKVFRKVRVAILATGSELKPAGQSLEPGEIYESNRLMLATLVRETGAIAEVGKVIGDDLEATVAALRHAGDADAIITCGGVSVGEYDFVKSAIQQLGGSLDFWRVAMKPGKPFLHATILGKPLFGLPGNPVSALVTFWLLARPALLRMGGAGDVSPAINMGELAEEISNPGDRRHFVRVKIDSNARVRASGPQASHRLGSLAAANGLVDVPAGERWEAGRSVRVLRF